MEKMIPTTEKELSAFCNLDEGEFACLSARKQIKKIVREYNLFKDKNWALRELEVLKTEYSEEMSVNAIMRLIAYLKLF